MKAVFRANEPLNCHFSTITLNINNNASKGLKQLNNKTMTQGNFDLMIMIALKLCFILSILFDAWGDASIDKTRKRNHTLELLDKVVLGLVLLIMWLYPYSISLIALFTYIPMRMGAFNVLYNKFRGLEYTYIGTTDKWYDFWIRWMGKVEAQPKKYYFPALTIWYFLLFFTGLFLF